jgi:outer membrane protein, heavy metal efflux system
MLVPKARCWTLAACALLSVAALQAGWAEDLTLDQAIQTALSHRPELRAADATMHSAEDLRKQAAAIPNPRVFYQSEDLRPGQDFSSNVETYAYVSQVLEVSGKRGARIGVGQAGVVNAELNADMQKRDIEFAVARAYWDALRLVWLRKLAEENENIYREILDYQQKRFSEGKLPEVDLMRVRLEDARAQTRLASSRLAEAQGRQRLAAEMGLPAATPWTLKADFEALNAPRPEAEGDAAYEQRVEVQLAKQRVATARANLTMQQAQGRPDLDALFGYKRNAGFNTMLAGVQLNVPLFDRNRAGVESAKSDIDAGREALAGVELRSQSEWALARNAYDTWKRQVDELYAPMVAQSNEIARISRAAYQEGGMELLRLLDAEELRVQTQTAWAEALGNYHQSVISLNYTAGLEP